MFRTLARAACAAAALLSAPAFSQAPAPGAADAAKKPAIEFSRIQDDCVRLEELPFGPGERWSACRLTRSGFVGTIGLLDFYYATWCLVAAGERCDRTALVVFANRAYRPEAQLQFHRIDPAGTRYDHVTMVGGDHSAIAVTIRRASGAQLERQYHTWADARWAPVDPAQWRAALEAELPRRLPAGLRATLPAQLLPEPERMALAVPLRRSRDDAPAGMAELEVRVLPGGLGLGEVRLPRPAR